MIVTMRRHIGGYRNGEPWPPAGGTIDVPDHEAADLIANGYAEEAHDAPAPADDVEPAEVDDEQGDAADDGPAEPAGEDDAAPTGAVEVDEEPVKPKRTRKA